MANFDLGSEKLERIGYGVQFHKIINALTVSIPDGKGRVFIGYFFRVEIDNYEINFIYFNR